ncbi:MAG: hypothetical protein JWR40_3786 [Massilia sp.]|nr:hypothetical protein [Massilia sp.]
MSIMIPHYPHLARRQLLPARALASLGIALASLLLAVACLAAAGAQSGAREGAREAARESHLERNVKAAFLYKFLGYVDFPEAATPAIGEPFIIGVLGGDGVANEVADEVADELRRISAGRGMNGRPVAVRKLRQGEAPGRLHLLFVAADDDADVDRALAALRHAPVLTVTQTPGPARADSVINFRVVDERVRFEVSLEAADKANLKLSSRLLAVACKVQRASH